MPTFRPVRLFATSLALASLGCQPGALIPAPAGTAPGAAAAAPSPAAVVASPPPLVTAALDGLVTAEGPVVGAMVRLVGLDGRPIGTDATHADDTFVTGGFVVPRVEMPADFRVVVTGGSVAGKPFTGELRAEVRGFHAQHGYVPVNPVTTAISAYMERNPGKSLGEATAAVRKALALPAFVDLGHGLFFSPRYFNREVYAAEAQQAGGPLAWAAAVAADAAAGRQRPALHNARYALHDIPPFLAEKLIRGIAKGAGAGAGDGQVGNFLRSIGTTDAQNALTQLGTVIGELDSLQQRLDQSTQSLQAAIAASAYALYASNKLQPLHVRNEHVKLELAQLLAMDPAESADVADKRAQLDAYIDANYTDYLTAWDLALCGDGAGGAGAIQLWSSQLVAGQSHFFTYDMANQVQAWWDAWDYRQALALSIWADRQKERGLSLATLKPQADAYAANRKNQLSTLRGAAQPSTVTDLSDMGGGAETIAVNAMPGRGNAVVELAGYKGLTYVWRTFYDYETYANAWSLPVYLTGAQAVTGTGGQRYLDAVRNGRASAEANTGVAASTWRPAGYMEMISLWSGPEKAAIDKYGFRFGPNAYGDLRGSTWILSSRGDEYVQAPDTRAWCFDPTTGVSHILGKDATGTLYFNYVTGQRFYHKVVDNRVQP